MHGRARVFADIDEVEERNPLLLETATLTGHCKHHLERSKKWLSAVNKQEVLDTLVSCNAMSSLNPPLSSSTPKNASVQTHIPSLSQKRRVWQFWRRILVTGFVCRSEEQSVVAKAAQESTYVHANYRFIVDPRGDYRAQTLDADVHLDWTAVLQILASAKSQAANCPICLSGPVASRMAKCGHIFCLPCLLRYMHSTDDTMPFPEKRQRWKKCPICWDSVYVSETRPVRWFTGQERDPPLEGADVVLRLISRQQGSTLALPRDGATSRETGEDVPWYIAAEVMDYARIMKGGEDYMAAEHDKEIEELQQQEREDELIFGEESQWTQKAIAAILDLKGRLKGLGNPPIMSDNPNERRSRHPPFRPYEDDPGARDIKLNQHNLLLNSPPSTASRGQAGQPASTITTSSDAFVTGRTSGTLSPIQERTSATPIERLSSQATSVGCNRDSPQRPGPLFFFYEALQHFYLSPLDIRILRTAFGEFSLFPSTILPRVERVSTGHIVDDDLRRRAKYLAHLPRGCEVAFLECDWTDIVSAEVLSGFSAEIERRRKRNREKEAREEKARVRAEKEEDDKRWAAARRKRPVLPSESFTQTEFEPLTIREGPEAVSSSMDSGFTSSSPPWPSSRARAGSSFASLASPSTSPVAPRTVWGTAAIAPASPVLAPVDHEQRLDEDDGWLQDWEEDLLHDDKLAVHLEATSVADKEAKAAATSTGNRKKKGRKVTLMSTNARRGA
ncbi:MAG: hypothetical protein LQ348_000763 [Seirophora lacunosa]|nr:MAG: hypothetical protein LQ348_000763 [Seirophora lacunosa]